MRLLAIILAFSITLAAGKTYAQVPAAPATQKPAATAPAPAPATQKPAAPAQPAPRFQDGLKYAFVNLQVVAANSNDGRAAAEKLKAFQDQKTRELQDRQKTLQAAQEKLEKGGTVLSDAARTQLQTDIERQQRDLQRLSEDANQDVQNLAQQVEEDFFRKTIPVVTKVAQEKQVHFVFNAAQSGLIWAEPGMDLTTEVITAMNATGGARPAPATAPAAPATPPAPGK